jgi:hypothetical protein
MNPFRVGTFGLFTIESELIEGLLSLHAARHECEGWVFVDKPPFDLLFVDITVSNTILAKKRFKTATVVRIAPGTPIHDSRTLHRPILCDELFQVLHVAKAHLSFLLESALNPVTIVLDPEQVRESQYRLNAWPPDSVLQSDPARLQIATILKDRPLKLTQLIQLTQLPVDKVRQFVHILRSTGLLDEQESHH